MPSYAQDAGLAREDLCRFIAACYYQPGPEFAEEKVFDSMCDAAVCIDPDLASGTRRLGEAFFAEGAENLLLDYTRLFLGPNHIIAKPYGSFWLETDQRLMGDSTVAAQALYHEAGFGINEEFRELPDHIAVELEFLYLLIYRENEARRKGNTVALKEAAGRRKHFLDEHLGRWIGPFAATVNEGAQTDFYRQLAEVTERFIRMEAAGDRAR